MSYAEGDEDPYAGRAWVKVQLLDEWNIAAGVAVLGGPVSPEFTVMSVDEKFLLATTMWGNQKTSTLVVPSPRLSGRYAVGSS